MKTYNFDTLVERRGSCSVKYDLAQSRFGRRDLIPLWVADMDFETPDFIREALLSRLKMPVYGYTFAPDEYWQSLVNWEKRLHNWDISREMLCYIPGIVKGIGMALSCFTQKGEAVVIQEPVYMPFRWVPERLGRRVIVNPLKLVDGKYTMDLENLDNVLNDAKVLILSNPHNPAGRVWESDVLRSVAEICTRHGAIVISDEIHADMALFGNIHHPFSSVSEVAKACSITFCAPSKTFNIAGIVSSFAVVPNPELREKFFGWLNAMEMADSTFLAVTATMAAYSNEGALWREQMLAYVEKNVEFVENFCRQYLPQIRPMRPEASFLVWLDCRDKKTSQDALVEYFLSAGLALNNGTDFGIGGEGFMRLNIGCPRAILQRALEALCK